MVPIFSPPVSLPHLVPPQAPGGEEGPLAHDARQVIVVVPICGRSGQRDKLYDFCQPSTHHLHEQNCHSSSVSSVNAGITHSPWAQRRSSPDLQTWPVKESTKLQGFVRCALWGLSSYYKHPWSSVRMWLHCHVIRHYNNIIMSCDLDGQVDNCTYRVGWKSMGSYIV